VSCKRTNHELRELVSLVETRLADGAMGLHRAAEMLFEHGAPMHVVSRIVIRAQQNRTLPA
jgi:hypothetical protein